MPLRMTVADYGVGNLHSIRKSLENCGAVVTVTSDMSELVDAECMVFPGVGAFDRTMERLTPFRDVIRDRLEAGVPALGVCIGMQILFEGSDEGTVDGLGLIPGRNVRIRARVSPHMGWNTVESDDPVMDGIDDRTFYFVHSYRGNPVDAGDAVGCTEYDGERFPVLFRKHNVYGTQFHPEKSSSSGMLFLENFMQFAEEQR